MSKFNNPFDDIIFWINLALFDFNTSINRNENKTDKKLYTIKEEKRYIIKKNKKNVLPN